MIALPPTKHQPKRISKLTLAILLLIALVCVVGAGWTLRRAVQLSKRGACLTNLRGLGFAIQSYQRKYDAFPGPDPLDSLIRVGLIEANQTRCPNGGRFTVVTPPISGKELKPTDIIAYEALANHGEAAAVLFADFHAEFVKAGAFEQRTDVGH